MLCCDVLSSRPARDSGPQSLSHPAPSSLLSRLLPLPRLASRPVRVPRSPGCL